MFHRSLVVVSGALLVSLFASSHARGALTARHYSTGAFELSLDGLSPTFVTSVDGGTMVSDVVTETGTRGNFVKKHIGSPHFEPLAVTVSAGPLPKVWFDWMNTALSGGDKPRSGFISMLDTSYKEQQRRSFTSLRLAEISTAKLDARENKKAFDIDLTFAGDSTTETKGSGQPNASTAGAKTKGVLASNFKITIPGLDTSQVTGVSEITVKVAGGGTPTRGAETIKAASAKAEVLPFSVRLNDMNADSWRAWHQSFVVKGNSSDSEEKTMTIDVMAQDLKTTIFRMRLEGVGIQGLGRSSPETPNTQGTPELQADLYAESFKFESMGTGK